MVTKTQKDNVMTILVLYDILFNKHQQCVRFIFHSSGLFISYKPGDLNTRKSSGTSCRMEIHFSIQTAKFLKM